MLDREKMASLDQPLTVVYAITNGVASMYQVASFTLNDAAFAMAASDEIERLAIESGRYPILITCPRGLYVVDTATFVAAGGWYSTYRVDYADQSVLL